MRFSELNKIMTEPFQPEPRPQARPVTAPAGGIKTPPPAPHVEFKAVPRPPPDPFRDLDLQAKEVYSRLLALAGEFLKSADQPYTEKYEAVLRSCRLAEETLKTNSVLLNYTSYSTPEDYLRAHTANTTVIAIAMGLAAGLEPSELKLLGFCAMAHDIGMTGYSDLYGREGRLTDAEFSEIALHTEAGVAKLERIVDLDYKIKDRAKLIILQTHERTDGSGYPDRLTDEQIDPLAQFIGIADVYEAMTHVRAWREPLNPPDVIKELIEKEGRGFNSKAVKALLSVLSIYPPYSLVALSTGEIARVIMVNKGSLTRPLVELLLDPDFALMPPHAVDLLEYPLTSIERAVDFGELRERNPKFAAKLDLARLWVEW